MVASLCSAAHADGMRRRSLLVAPFALPLAACGNWRGDGVPPGEGRVTTASDGGGLILDDGREVRLAGLVPPRPQEGAGAAEPFFEEARGVLSGLAAGRRPEVIPAPGFEPTDRWGRLVGRVTLPEVDGVSVNREMVARGFARVRPEEEEDGEARSLLALEASARAARRGIWASPYYAVREADAVTLGAQGSFQIVEGVVVDAAAVRRWIYLNYGPDYRTDFTAGAPPEFSDRFDEDAMLALPAARVRVRGEIERYNGPFIRLVVPAQVERMG